jgi:hypothetical protein
MENVYGLFVIIICVTIVYIVANHIYDNLVWTSADDGQTYLVQNLPDKKDAANLLAKVKNRLITLIRKLKSTYSTNKNVNRLHKRFSPENIREVAAHSSLTSYSVNKGEKIIMCIRSRDGKNTLTDLNTIMFVALHELAHVMTISVGHTSEFWENFRYILAHAIHWKLYKPVNFRQKPVPYCGTNITDTPLHLQDMPKYIGHLETPSDLNEVSIKNMYKDK